MITDYNRQTVVQKPSRFVTEVPPELYDIWSLEEEGAGALSSAEDESQKYIN
jgi:hypothetical protein